MSYYWFNREKLLKNAWNKYHNKGGKQKAAEYYKKNADVIKFEAKNKYKNTSEKEKKKKGKYQRERYYMPNLNEKLKQYQRDYYTSKKSKKSDLYCIKDN